jgi:hypothetical protein
MNDVGHAHGEFERLCRRGFEEFGALALWNKSQAFGPTPEDALVIARALRREGNMDARRLAEQIEAAARAAHRDPVDRARRHRSGARSGEPCRRIDASQSLSAPLFARHRHFRGDRALE